jgi:peptide/nickel transport system substrate-binding protein
MRSFALRSAGVSIATVVLAAACWVGPPSNTAAAGGAAESGGVFRTAVPYLPLSDQLDPTGEYTNFAWGVLSQLLVRALVTYRHVAGPRGEVPVPDLATDLGTVSADGLTYTFHLKRGITFGPPLGRPITSADIAYAFERMAMRQVGAQYAFYFDGVIRGFKVHGGPPRPIAGIDLPDPRTIVFRLTRPTGDFVQRLTLPATGPIPSEVARCFLRPGGYGRDLVSSGPYMIRGAQRVDPSRCSTLKPMGGFDPARRLVLVRNPDYDPDSDDPSVRANLIDGVHIGVDRDVADIFRRIRSGELDGSLGTFAVAPPDAVDRRYLSNPRLRPLLHSDGLDVLYYLNMNLLVPPFDDPHVRRAVAYAIDRTGLIHHIGGRIAGDVAAQLFPPNLLPAAKRYDPYPDHHGDIGAAAREMARSRYDGDGDGRCDARVCRDVLFLTRNTGGYPAAARSVAGALRGIGIHLRVRTVSTGTGYTLLGSVDRLVPISLLAGWIKDYSDPYTMVDVTLDSKGIDCYGQTNYAEVGMTRAQAHECGVLHEWKRARPPSLDRFIAICGQTSGRARSDCWLMFDMAVMQSIVPWVPYRFARSLTIVSRSVGRYEFDQFSGTLSLCHVALAR